MKHKQLFTFMKQKHKLSNVSIK